MKLSMMKHPRIFADATSTTVTPDTLILIRFFDIILGSVIGFIGGWVLHQPKIFAYAKAKIKPGKSVSRE